MRTPTGRSHLLAALCLRVAASVAALLVPIAAWAQTAAPSLNPVLMLTTVPSNPAVLSWDAPSRVSLAIGPMTQDFTGTPAEPDAEGTLRTAAASLVTERFTVAVASLDAALDYNAPLTGSSGSDATVIYLAGRFGEALTLGVGIESGSAQDSVFGTNSEEDTPLLGVTYRFGDSLYLGAAGGTATVRDLTVTPTAEGSRGITRFGAAYHSRTPDRSLHVELFHEEKDAIVATNTNEESANGFALEVVYANILLGYVANRQERNSPAGIDLGGSDVTAVTVGYVPAPGLAIVASRLDADVTDPSGAVTFTIGATSVGLAWQF